MLDEILREQLKSCPCNPPGMSHCNDAGRLLRREAQEVDKVEIQSNQATRLPFTDTSQVFIGDPREALSSYGCNVVTSFLENFLNPSTEVFVELESHPVCDSSTNLWRLISAP